MGLKLNEDYLKGVIELEDVESQIPRVDKAHEALENKTGRGADFTGWLDLPGQIRDEFLKDLNELGEEVRKNSDCIVSIGIGGSYLGIRATLEAIGGSKIPFYYCGHQMSSDSVYQLLETIKDKRVTVVVISKSGTTTEPAVAFRIIKAHLQKKYSHEELSKRIICVTDAYKGALLQIAQKGGYRRYVIPDDVGGRFSILTPVGLVPLALAGADITAFVRGAQDAQKLYSTSNLEKNLAYRYAVNRILLYRHQGKQVEVLSSFYDNMFYVAEWWKQLFGESEGKDQKGIFPASLIMSTDLHSMGQLMQDGHRNIFETFLQIEKPRHSVIIPKEDQDLDGFNIVAGKDLDYVNKQGYKATAAAHFEGGVPNMTIELERADEYHMGHLYYFFERAVAMAGYLIEVNPFDQPGVEAYKKKMFALLGKT